jgi:hypothetical protein
MRAHVAMRAHVTPDDAFMGSEANVEAAVELAGPLPSREVARVA